MKKIILNEKFDYLINAVSQLQGKGNNIYTNMTQANEKGNGIHDDPLMIFTPDCYFEPQIDPKKIDSFYDGLVCVFKSSSPAHSYVRMNQFESLVAETKEKEVISDKAIGGLYYFKKGSTFVSNAKFMIENDMRRKC